MLLSVYDVYGKINSEEFLIYSRKILITDEKLLMFFSNIQSAV